jgi:hypothetical protein
MKIVADNQRAILKEINHRGLYSGVKNFSNFAAFGIFPKSLHRPSFDFCTVDPLHPDPATLD